MARKKSKTEVHLTPARAPYCEVEIENGDYVRVILRMDGNHRSPIPSVPIEADELEHVIRLLNVTHKKLYGCKVLY